MSNPRSIGTVSVIIPNYNNEKYIGKCIESVLEQTYKGLREIIVVDDCSTDNSRCVIENLCKSNSIIKPIFLVKNCKVSHARNVGLKAATSDYVTFLDGDDIYYSKTKLENEMNIILQYADIGVDAVSYSCIVRIDEQGAIKSMSRPTISECLQGNVYNKLLTTRYMGKIMRDYCVKRSSVMSLQGYNEDRSFFEDYELILKLARDHPFYCTGDYGTGYRDTSNGLSKKSYEDQLKAIYAITKQETELLPIFKKCRYRFIIFACFVSKLSAHKARVVAKNRINKYKTDK